MQTPEMLNLEVIFWLRLCLKKHFLTVLYLNRILL